MTSQTAPILPGYLVGTWAIDPIHSEISFVVRHLGVSKVRGRFEAFEGVIVTAEDPLESTVSVKIQAASLSTSHEQRDAHVRSEEFLSVEAFPELVFTSTAIRFDGSGHTIDGVLTVRGVSKPVTLDVEPNGFGEGYQGVKVAGFSATTEISRKDFGVTGGAAGAMLGDKVMIALEIEAIRQD